MDSTATRRYAKRGGEISVTIKRGPSFGWLTVYCSFCSSRGSPYARCEKTQLAEDGGHCKRLWNWPRHISAKFDDATSMPLGEGGGMQNIEVKDFIAWGCEYFGIFNTKRSETNMPLQETCAWHCPSPRFVEDWDSRKLEVPSLFSRGWRCSIRETELFGAGDAKVVSRKIRSTSSVRCFLTRQRCIWMKERQYLGISWR